jgi:hypothetical protein
MIFEANRKNEGRETWFGYFKNDKFEKRKNQGRIDARGLYKEEKARWLNAYHNSKEVAGLSVKQEVKGEDEWCAEAYMETDYSTLNQVDFEQKLKDYIAFKFLRDSNIKTLSVPNIKLYDLSKTELVKLSDVFDIWYGVNLEVVNCDEIPDGMPFVSRKSQNNGISTYVRELYDILPNPANTLSIACSGSVLSTFYHDYEYYSGRDVYIAKPKYALTKEQMLYYAYVIEQNKYRYNYGRQANKTLKNILVPKLK